VLLLAPRVALIRRALIDASGRTGGGTVLVGGDYQGANPNIRNASRTYLGAEAIVRADAIDRGDGGKVIVWADDTTRAYGTISARGRRERRRRRLRRGIGQAPSRLRRDDRYPRASRPPRHPAARPDEHHGWRGCEHQRRRDEWRQYRQRGRSR
jgi:hypothetical protein